MPGNDEADCEPCKLGVLIGVGKYICEQSASPDGRRECDELYEKVLTGEVQVKEFIAKVREKVTDPEFLRVLDGASTKTLIR